VGAAYREPGRRPSRNFGSSGIGLTPSARSPYRRRMATGSNYLDPDRPGTERLSVAEARALGEGALAQVGYEGDDARIVVDQLIDNSPCGYRFAGLPRIPSRRAFRERERRRAEGILVDRAVIDALNAL
jgi:hypothetical protein